MSTDSVRHQLRTVIIKCFIYLHRFRVFYIRFLSIYHVFLIKKKTSYQAIYRHVPKMKQIVRTKNYGTDSEGILMGHEVLGHI